MTLELLMQLFLQKQHKTINGDLIVTGTLSGTGGVNIGIQSAGQNVTTGVITALNFIGAGNTFVYDTLQRLLILVLLVEVVVV